MHAVKQRASRKLSSLEESFSFLLAPMLVMMQTPFLTAKGKSNSIHSETANIISNNKETKVRLTSHFIGV